MNNLHAGRDWQLGHQPGAAHHRGGVTHLEQPEIVGRAKAEPRRIAEPVVGDISARFPERAANLRFGQLARHDMGGEVAKADFVRIEHEAGHDLVLMRVVRRDAGEVALPKLAIPFLEKLRPMTGGRRKAFVRIGAEGAGQLAPARCIIRGLAHISGHGWFEFGVGVAITDLHAVEACRVGVGAILNVAEEAKFASGLRLSLGIKVGKPQLPILLRAGHEQHAVAQAVPGFRLRPAMVAQHHDPHAGFLRRRQHLGAGASGMVGILRVNVDHGSIILVNAEIGNRDPLAEKLQPRFMRRLQVLPLHALNGIETPSGRLRRRSRKQSCTPKAAQKHWLHGRRTYRLHSNRKGKPSSIAMSVLGLFGQLFFRRKCRKRVQQSQKRV